MAGRNIHAGESSGLRLLGIGALGGQARGQPVELADRVVVYLAEAEALEPPRGSWGHVSSTVPAVDDHRSILVEHLCALGVDVPKRNADRLWPVVLRVLFGRQHLDQLRTCCDHAS